MMRANNKWRNERCSFFALDCRVSHKGVSSDQGREREDDSRVTQSMSFLLRRRQRGGDAQVSMNILSLGDQWEEQLTSCRVSYRLL